MTHCVLWIVSLSCRLMLMMPAPPKPSMTNENVTASIIGSSQGNALTQPNGPLPPRRRPAIGRGDDRG